MGKSMADVLMERGWTEGWTKAEVKTRQQTLVRLLRKRFGNVPRGVVRVVESTVDVAKLDDWLDRVLTARTPDELEILTNDQRPTTNDQRPMTFHGDIR